MREFISPIIAKKIPSFLESEYNRFYAFIKNYFDFLEEIGNPLELLETFSYKLDTNNEVDIYVDKVLQELGFDIKNLLTIPKSELVNHLREFYLARGTPNSFVFLFKILYGIENEDVKIDYPRKRLLIPSAATYDGKYHIFTTATSKDNSLTQKNYWLFQENVNSFDTQVTGIASRVKTNINSSLLIEGYISENNSRNSFLQLQVDKPIDEFRVGELVDIYSRDSNSTIRETIIPVIDLNITSPGKNYKVGDTISISNVISPGTATVKIVSSGSIDSVSIINGGINYSIGETIVSQKLIKGSSFSAIISNVENTTNYLSIPTHSSLRIESDDFTIETWIYRRRSNIVEGIIGNQNVDNDQGWSLWIDSDDSLKFSINGSLQTDKVLFKKNSIKPFRWNHIAVSRESDTIRIYVNGSLIESYTTTDGVVSMENVIIGKVSENVFIGLLDDLRLTKNVCRYNKQNYSISNGEFSTVDDEFYTDVSLLLKFNGTVGQNNFTDSSQTPKIITVHGNIKFSKSEVRYGKSAGEFYGTGSITGIKILNHGYDYDQIPNLIVKTNLGSGAVLQAVSNTIGQIKQLKFDDPYIGIIDDSQPNIATISSISGSGAVLTPIIRTSFTEPKSFITHEGILGLNSTLLDSYYFQQFSYSVRSPITRTEYDSIVDSWLHPVGFIRFAILDISYRMSEFLSYDINFYINIYNYITGPIMPYIINPIYNIEWFKNLSDINFSNFVGGYNPFDIQYNSGFHWYTLEQTGDSLYYMSQALDIAPIPSMVFSADTRFIVNTQSTIELHKEDSENYLYNADYWKDRTLNNIDDDTIVMKETFESEIVSYPQP